MASDSRTSTGREVVVFGRGGWGRVRKLAEPHLAQGRFRPLLFPETGHAVLQDISKRSIARLRATGAQVRKERVLRRPNSVVSSSPRATVVFDDSVRSWALTALGLPTSARDGAGVVVGLIDSGVDQLHPALAGNVSVGSTHGGVDALGHGTHCAGIIAGRLLGGRPRFGIAPGAHIRSYRLFEQNGEATEGRVRELVQRAVTDGCHVIVLAAGTPMDTFFPTDATLGRWLASAGRIMVAAAGNESNRLGGVVKPTLAPANAPDIYAVGAVTAATRLWNSSNGFGYDAATRVDVVAPGVDVLSAWPGGRTLHMSGSSVATAVAGGVAAALWSRRPSWRAADVCTAMLRLARKDVLGQPDGFGAGLLSLAAL